MTDINEIQNRHDKAESGQWGDFTGLAAHQDRGDLIKEVKQLVEREQAAADLARHYRGKLEAVTELQRYSVTVVTTKDNTFNLTTIVEHEWDVGTVVLNDELQAILEDK